jgi:hypothetical protein
MPVETLGEAYRLNWRVRARCVRAGLDMPTLVWAKGLNFPLGRLGSRLMCPQCGSRDVNVICEPPPMSKTVVGSKA